MTTRKRKADDEELVALPSDESEEEEEYEDSDAEAPAAASAASDEDDSDEDEEELEEDEVQETAPPTKKRKFVANDLTDDKDEVAPVNDDEGDDNELDEDEPADDGLEDEEDTDPEETVCHPGPTSKAAEVKGGIIPKEDNLDEVEAAVADDEDDE
ncbi:1e890fa9-6995-435c-ba95-59310c66ff64 [Sclerotinia trifoliorum]|uniref:1e890fa9-6995-435c-ba95-59310c66ff64 n=1 Tax=Sclerotinia trifoliorum TaxID=28548 RepID=A0A8H2W060_9HELO|nr:1e890fa9-6995-435c-ba95-59310c66ff64 [Sclerotinia trifoliorum]